MISLMSVNNCSDIAPLDDLEDIPDLESSGDISEHVIDFTQQLEQLTSSLNSPTEPQTPKSVPSLPEDPTPIVEATEIPRMKFPEEFEKLPSVPVPVPTSNGGLFHSFNFKEEKSKPAPLASPEQDKLPEKEVPDPPKLAPEVKKRIDLQPLNLKKSYDFDHKKEPVPIVERTEKPRTGTLGRDKTPGQDLLEWCKDVTKNHENVKVTNLTTSFKNGMAFAAIIAHHRPDLIELNNLAPSDIVGNCKKAFEAGEKLGIPRVIEPSDMSLLAVPDKLAVMTYLYQLHSHFTGRQLEVDRIGEFSESLET